MRSRTSRGVPEWSGGEELYIGSPVSATGKVSGVTGIVPGPPEGSRGSTGWGHLSRRAPWAESGREPALSGLGRPPMGLPPAPRVGNPRVGGRPTCLGGQGTPWPPPPHPDGIPGRRPPLPGGLYKGGEGGQQLYSLGRLPPPLLHPSLSQTLGEALPRSRYIHHHAVMLLALHQPLLPPCWIKKRRRRCTIRVLNAEVPSVRHSVIGDLNHGEYDSVIHVHWNASARDLQGYVDALLSPRC